MGARPRISDSGSMPSEVLGSPSRPLDPGARHFMEDRLGLDLSAVRVHTGSQAAASAQSMNAEAYTVGNHIVFGEGRYDASTPGGRSLLAHELAHVVQQAEHSSSPGGLRVQRKPLTSGSPQTLRFGARGALVQELQRRLNEVGAGAALSVDGIFGPLTHAAVVAVQRANGLVPDGVVGPKTWSVLGPTAPAAAAEVGTEAGAEPARIESFDETLAGVPGASAVGMATGINKSECDRQRTDCYWWCAKFHLWRLPPDVGGWLHCQRSCCDWAHKQCLKDGSFPCLYRP